MITLRRNPTMFIFIVFASAVLANCARGHVDGHSSVPTVSAESSYTSMPSALVSPDAALLPTVQSRVTPTSSAPSNNSNIPPRPTISPAEEARLANLLQLQECELPCYLGITPGKTLWGEAINILKTLGAHSTAEYEDNGLPVYEYTLDVGDPSVAFLTPGPDTGVGDLIILHRVGLTIGDGIVQRITLHTQAERFKAKYHEYWSRYGSAKVLQHLGEPDEIFFWISERGTGYGWVIVYEDLSVVIEFNGVQRGDFVCPLLAEEDGILTSVDMTLTNPIVLPDIYAPGEKVPPTDPRAYLPIDDALGITAEEFYERLQADPSACFEIKETTY